MFEVEWDIDEGWGAPRIVPVHNLPIHPAAKVLHYASEVVPRSEKNRLFTL